MRSGKSFKEVKILEKVKHKNSLSDVLLKIDRIIELLDRIIKNQAGYSIDTPPQLLDSSALLALPDHLRKTANVALRMGRVTAQDIADVTKRERAVESAYLNQLCTMGYLKKERDGRKVFFWIEYGTSSNTCVLESHGVPLT